VTFAGFMAPFMYFDMLWDRRLALGRRRLI
jgi:hypothetical protein